MQNPRWQPFHCIPVVQSLLHQRSYLKSGLKGSSCSLPTGSLQLVICICRCPSLSFATSMQVSLQVMHYASTSLLALMCSCCSGAARTWTARPCRMQAATDTPSQAPVRATVRYQGIHHAGFLVQDTAKSVEWYCSILGRPFSMPVPCFRVAPTYTVVNLQTWRSEATGLTISCPMGELGSQLGTR